MKKTVSLFTSTAIVAAMLTLPQTASAAVSMDEYLTEWGFFEYHGPNGINAGCSIVDSETDAHGEVLQIYASENVNRDNRYGGIEYDIELQPGTYRITAEFMTAGSTGNDVGRQVFVSLATSTHGANWGSMVTYPEAESNWTVKSYTVTVSSAAKYKVQFGVAGNFIAYFDNIKVYNTADVTMANLLPTSDFSTVSVIGEELSAPENVCISSEEYGSATLSWDAVENASSYTVFKSVDGSPLQEVARTSGTNVDVTNTTGRNMYLVQAIGDNVNYISSTAYGTIEFEECRSKAGLPRGVNSIINNATGDIIFDYETVAGGHESDTVLKMSQLTPGTNGNNWGGIRIFIDPAKLIKGHTYYFGFYYKKDSLNDEEYTKILSGVGNTKGNRQQVQASTGDYMNEWGWWSNNKAVCTDPTDFGIDIIVNRNASAYIDGIVCYDMADAKHTNLIENGDFEQKYGSDIAEAENIKLIQGVDEVGIKWDYPADTIWQGAEIWNVTDDFEMTDPQSKIAEIEKTSNTEQLINVPVTFGEINIYKLVLVDIFGNRSDGTDIILSGSDGSQSTYNFVQPEGWSIGGEAAEELNENSPMAIMIDKNYYTENDGALYIAQTKGEAAHYVCIKQEIDAEPSTTYVLSYDVKGIGATIPNKWRSEMFFAADKFNGQKAIAFSDTAKPYWQTKTMEYTTGESENTIWVNMIFRSSCELWLDNFIVYKKSDSQKNNLLVNGTFTGSMSAAELVDAECVLVDDEFTYLTYEMEENSAADRVLIKSADGEELYAIAGANVYEINLNSLFVDGDIPEELKLVVCDVYGNETEGITVSTAPVEEPQAEIGDIVIANGKATVSVTNRTEKPVSLIMIAAAYDTDGRLLKTNVSQQYSFGKQSSQAAPYTAEVTLPSESANIRVFVWDGVGSMAPLKNAK